MNPCKELYHSLIEDKLNVQIDYFPALVPHGMYGIEIVDSGYWIYVNWQTIEGFHLSAGGDESGWREDEEYETVADVKYRILRLLKLRITTGIN